MHRREINDGLVIMVGCEICCFGHLPLASLGCTSVSPLSRVYPEPVEGDISPQIRQGKLFLRIRFTSMLVWGRLGDGHFRNKELRDFGNLGVLLLLSNHCQRVKIGVTMFFIYQLPLSFLAWLRLKRVMPCLPVQMK